MLTSNNFLTYKWISENKKIFLNVNNYGGIWHVKSKEYQQYMKNECKNE